jgi:hypothetical protein
MDLENEVRTIMDQSANWLSVEQVAQTMANRIMVDRTKKHIRSILNALVESGELTSDPGGGGYVCRL